MAQIQLQEPSQNHVHILPTTEKKVPGKYAVWDQEYNYFFGKEKTVFRRSHPMDHAPKVVKVPISLIFISFR